MAEAFTWMGWAYTILRAFDKLESYYFFPRFIAKLVKRAVHLRTKSDLALAVNWDCPFPWPL